MSLAERGFTQIDTRVPLEGISSEIVDGIIGIIEMSLGRQDLYTHLDSAYQRGREYVFQFRTEIDFAEIQPGEDYTDRWIIREMYEQEQNLRIDLESTEKIRFADYPEVFYLRNSDVTARIWPYNDDGVTAMNHDILVEIEGELIDVASLTRKSARAF